MFANQQQCGRFIIRIIITPDPVCTVYEINPPAQKKTKKQKKHCARCHMYCLIPADACTRGVKLKPDSLLKFVQNSTVNITKKTNQKGDKKSSCNRHIETDLKKITKRMSSIKCTKQSTIFPSMQKRFT